MTPLTGPERKSAVIDVGSNSVRLVVYEGPRRARMPIFNERQLCGLGRDLGETGRLHTDGRASALDTLDRFAALLRRMVVGDIQAVATAAVREAEDGPEFCAEIRRRHGLEVRVLSGEEEAGLAAKGVLYGIPDADGLIGDLGGASLELATVTRGRIGHRTTLPLGPLRFPSGLHDAAAAAVIDGHYSALPWLRDGAGKRLYVVGGAWRSLARVDMAQRGHPVEIVHQYELPWRKARDLVRLLARQHPQSLKRISGISNRRLETLPVAALTLRRLLLAVRPAVLVFSAGGLREGLLYDGLAAEERGADPFLASCRHTAALENRFAAVGEEFFDWMAPLFTAETPSQARLRRAACLLSDVAWRVHPNYRDGQAFRRVLRAPYSGVTHPERVAVAFAVYVRYRGAAGGAAVGAALNLLTPEQQARASRIGIALRLGHTLSGGMAEIAAETRLRTEGGVLVMDVPPRVQPFLGDVVQRRLDALARQFDRTAEIRLVAG